MSKYDHLDDAIIDAIGSGTSTFTSICANVDHEVRVIAADGPKDKPECRYVDARLQALRKQGLIKFAKGHWSIA
ncbi:hypothetical protein ACP93_02440 [Xanthomonas sp. NCPPB 1128]|uniref:hypothetical protein n=1 Tax=Xanthomonas sp. NCPPB 1128 TaxID=1775876 RepID=UPI00065AF2C0|nr:hypothetical protein [Xanthomonas sp. NCPPB 1128]KMM77043.1 hypothetical protein ACP93_02175 [Xanthomonas sp. NCPPB 1128]KMM77087.1 hypothetical protein ACP93_02440 [Xanthomonas sp. NCPPB 1128]